MTDDTKQTETETETEDQPLIVDLSRAIFWGVAEIGDDNVIEVDPCR